MTNYAQKKLLIYKFCNIINFYSIVCILYLIFFLIKRLYITELDTLYLYHASLKPLINQKIYEGYSFIHGPHIIFIFELLNFFKINSFNFLLFLGFLQSIFAGYLSIIFCKKIIQCKVTKKIIFLVTIFFFSNEFDFFFWDCYVLLIGIYALYLIFFTKKYILGLLFLSVTWFLKQTFGLTFFFIFIILSLVNFYYFKKKFFLLNIIYYFLFIFFNLVVIFFLYDFNKFYDETITFTLRFADQYGRINILNYLFGIIFIFPDINNIDQFKSIFTREKFSYIQIIFYLIFRIPVFFLNFFLLFKIKDFFKNYYLAFLIISLSCILPLPLLGRGYWGTIYFFPTITIIFFKYICEKKLFSNGILIRQFLIIYSYTFIIFILIFLYFFRNINYDLNWSKNIIQSKSNFFLNINKNSLPKNSFDDTRDMYEFLEKNRINNIFILNHTCTPIMALLAQAPVNRNYMGISSTDKFFNWDSKFWSMNETNRQRFINDFNTKAAKYILYNNSDYLSMVKDLPKDLLKNYSLKYSNNNFTLLKINNYK